MTKTVEKPNQNPNTQAGKVLKKPAKTSSKVVASVLTQRVIKESSATHRDALKRLVDR